MPIGARLKLCLVDDADRRGLLSYPRVASRHSCPEFHDAGHQAVFVEDTGYQGRLRPARRSVGPLLSTRRRSCRARCRWGSCVQSDLQTVAAAGSRIRAFAFVSVVKHESPEFSMLPSNDVARRSSGIRTFGHLAVGTSNHNSWSGRIDAFWSAIYRRLTGPGPVGRIVQAGAMAPVKMPALSQCPFMSPLPPVGCLHAASLITVGILLFRYHGGYGRPYCSRIEFR